MKPKAKDIEIELNGGSIKEKKWTDEFIEKLPDTSFAYIETKGKEKIRYFPYQDEKGSINIESLKEALDDVLEKRDSKGRLFGSRAIKILKRAAKRVRIGEYAENWKGGFGQFQSIVQIDESFFKNEKYKPNDEKKEVVLPILVEGWGNARDKNYYTPRAVMESAHYVLGKNKMYLNHPKAEEDDEPRDIRKWAATVKETWTDKTPDNKTITMGRVQVYDDWLWKRFKEAPGQIGTSLLGRGKARDGIMEGKRANIIESIENVRSCDFVDYPGNTPLGMTYFVESEQFEEDLKDDKIKQEEDEMKLEDLTLETLKEGNPELVKAIEKKAVTDKENDTKTVAEKEKRDKEVKDLKEENKTLKTDLDAIQVKEKLAEKEKLVDKMLKESNLPDVAKTDVFRKLLLDCDEKKDGDKTISVEEQVKALIDDRLVSIGEKKEESPIKNSGKPNESEKISEDQKQFNEQMFDIKEEEQK